MLVGCPNALKRWDQELAELRAAVPSHLAGSWETQEDPRAQENVRLTGGRRFSARRVLLEQRPAAQPPQARNSQREQPSGRRFGDPHIRVGRHLDVVEAAKVLVAVV